MNAPALACRLCGAPCREDARFCSQCGTSSPAAEPASGSTRATVSRPAAVSSSGTQPVPAPVAEATVPNFGSRYRIERLLGSGSMGSVYQAVDLSVDERVALKILPESLAAEPGAIERFKRELKMARRIRHRNVVQSYDIGFADGRWYISMEYVEGENLWVVLSRRRRLPEREALGILRQVLRGLKAAHDLGIVHRDIKAENVLVNSHGMAFVTDFGVAAPAHNKPDEVAGTPLYMAPEQFRGEPPTTRTDLYACGVMLYLMLAGSFPFETDEGMETMRAVLYSHTYSPAKPIPDDVDVSTATRELAARLLEKDQDRRPADAGEVVDLLDALLAKPAAALDSGRPIALVVDEDEADSATIERVLDELGYQVLRGADARTAVDLAFSKDPDLVVLHSDIPGGLDLAIESEPDLLPAAGVMAGANGFGFCRMLQADEKLSRVPLIVTTRDVQPSVRMGFELAGARSVLRKPIVPEELLRACPPVAAG